MQQDGEDLDRKGKLARQQRRPWRDADWARVRGVLASRSR